MSVFPRDPAISSPDNPRFKTWRALQETKGIKQNGLILVAGRKIVPEICRDTPSQVESVLLSTDEAMGRSLGFQGPVFRLAPALFRLLDEFGTEAPLAVLRAPVLAEASLEVEPQGLEVVLSLSDPQNLGAVLRSAAAFAATKVLLLGSCAHPFLPRVTRAASGLNLRAPLARSSLPIDAIPHAFALDMQGDNLFEHPLPRDIRLVIGEEGQGIPASFSGSRLRIPTDPIVESLNAAVAASLAMAEYRRRFRLF